VVASVDSIACKVFSITVADEHLQQVVKPKEKEQFIFCLILKQGNLYHRLVFIKRKYFA